MSRIEKLAPEAWDVRLREAVQPEALTALEQGLMRFFAHCPEQALGLLRFSAAMRAGRRLPARLVELMRLRIAFHNQCRSCMAIRYQDALADGLTEALVCSLEAPDEAAELTPAEKAAIRYGEKLATDHLAISDSDYAELREHFSEAEIVELGMTAAFFVGFGRLGATWHMVEELPEAFRGIGPIAPWGQDRIVVR
ncbi:carboxymuconolactone decarboxylase family protein [Thermaurantiacus sp.]